MRTVAPDLVSLGRKAYSQPFSKLTVFRCVTDEEMVSGNIVTHVTPRNMDGT